MVMTTGAFLIIFMVMAAGTLLTMLVMVTAGAFVLVLVLFNDTLIDRVDGLVDSSTG